jgi:Na+/H+-dicarboxylate symporter
MVGGLADMIDNIGAVLFIAFIAGVISGVFSQFIYNKINRNSIIDSHGLLGPILVVSLIASFIIHPSILSQLFIRNQTIRGTGSAETDYRLARYHLVYFAITIGIAITTGILVGGIFRIKRNPNRDYEDTKFFIDDYGLYNY